MSSISLNTDRGSIPATTVPHPDACICKTSGAPVEDCFNFSLLANVADFYAEHKIEPKLSSVNYGCLLEIFKEHSVFVFGKLPEMVAASLIGDLNLLKDYIKQCSFNEKRNKLLFNYLNDSFTYTYVCLFLKLHSSCGIPNPDELFKPLRDDLNLLRLGINTFQKMIDADPSKRHMRDHAVQFLDRVDLMSRFAEVKAGHFPLFRESLFKAKKIKNDDFSPDYIVTDTGVGDGDRDLRKADKVIPAYTEKSEEIVRKIQHSVFQHSKRELIKTFKYLIDLHFSYYRRFKSSKFDLGGCLIKIRSYFDQLNPDVPDLTHLLSYLKIAVDSYKKFYQAELDRFSKLDAQVKGIHIAQMRQPDHSSANLDFMCAQLVIYCEFSNLLECLHSSCENLFVDPELMAKAFKFHFALAKYLSIEGNLKKHSVPIIAQLHKDFRVFLFKVFEEGNPNFRNKAEKYFAATPSCNRFSTFCFANPIHFSIELFISKLGGIHKKFSEIIKGLNPEEMELLSQRYRDLSILLCNVVMVVKQMDRMKKDRSADFIMRDDLISLLFLDPSKSTEPEQTIVPEEFPVYTPPTPLPLSVKEESLEESKTPPRIKVKTRGVPHPELLPIPPVQEAAQDREIQVQDFTGLSQKMKRRVIIEELESIGFEVIGGASHDHIRARDGTLVSVIPRNGDHIAPGTVSAINRQVEEALKMQASRR